LNTQHEQIIPRDHFGECLVKSLSRKGHHHVDICDLSGNGSCTCEDFVIRKLPRYQVTGKITNLTRCKHIRKAREFWLDAIITEKNNKR